MKCIIKKNDWDEFEVPTGANAKDDGGACIYFTDDKQDAKDTARAAHGDDVEIVFRKGSYS